MAIDLTSTQIQPLERIALCEFDSHCLPHVTAIFCPKLVNRFPPQDL